MSSGKLCALVTGWEGVNPSWQWERAALLAPAGPSALRVCVREDGECKAEEGVGWEGKLEGNTGTTYLHSQWERPPGWGRLGKEKKAA